MFEKRVVQLLQLIIRKQLLNPDQNLRGNLKLQDFESLSHKVIFPFFSSCHRDSGGLLKSLRLRRHLKNSWKIEDKMKAARALQRSHFGWSLERAR